MLTRFIRLFFQRDPIISDTVYIRQFQINQHYYSQTSKLYS